MLLRRYLCSKGTPDEQLPKSLPELFGAERVDGGIKSTTQEGQHQEEGHQPGRQDIRTALYTEDSARVCWDVAYNENANHNAYKGRKNNQSIPTEDERISNHNAYRRRKNNQSQHLKRNKE